MTYFVNPNSIVRQIWGKSDTILFIFAGASAEFALNKAVDWLYFTGKLPSDPLGRLFSTVSYAKQIIYLDEENALKAIDKITAIHSSVEASRGMKIPDWAYRDVLYMLIHYSIASFELLEMKLSDVEKEEIFDVFIRVGNRMCLKNLPENYKNWLIDREIHLENDLKKSNFTDDLYFQYKKNLGWYRYTILIEAQKLIIPKTAINLLNLSQLQFIKPLISVYKIFRKFKLESIIKTALLPKNYFQQIIDLDKKNITAIQLSIK
jgi:ER-bound oxygenase mpaB/B'/Rubber oxygenase, catalytic domain